MTAFILKAIGLLAILCQVLFIIGIVNNMVKNKSLTAWLYPGGTTKVEKAYLITVFSLVIIFGIIVILVRMINN